MSPPPPGRRCRLLTRAGLTALVVPLIASPAGGWAQDQVRPSNVAARLFRPVSFEQRDYNAKLGPVSFRVSADLRTEFNDNIELTERDRESDLILSPTVGLSSYWAITPYNALSLNLSFGYHFYLAHPELNRSDSGLTIDPSTELSFDIYSGSFRFNFHERPSIQQDPAGEPTLSNVAIFGRFVNTAGMGVDWAINRHVSLTASYDHTDFIATQSEFSFADFSQDQIASTATVTLNDAMTAGPEAAVTSTRYRTAEKADAFSAHVGLFGEVLLTPYTRVRLAGGYQGVQFSGDQTSAILLVQDPTTGTTTLITTPTQRTGGDENTYYFNFRLTNQLSRYYLQSLTVSKETQLGITSESVNLFSIHYASSWTLNRWLTLQTNLFYENGRETGTASAEHFTRWGASLATNFQLTRKLGVSLGYDYILKDSDLPLQSYVRNTIFAEFHFAF